VTEGRVRVDDAEKTRSLLAPTAVTAEPPVLAAGERATVAVTARAAGATPVLAAVAKVPEPEIRRALAWQERRLEFDAEPLADVVHEFNRYNRTRLVIADEQLATKRFSGTFRADGYDSLVRLLETDFGVDATRSGREIILRVRR
jgi:transmembrane sensor